MWVLFHHDSSAAPQTVQTASPVCGTKNFSSVRLYSAPQLHRTIVAILGICPRGTPDQAQCPLLRAQSPLPQSARRPPVRARIIRTRSGEAALLQRPLPGPRGSGRGVPKATPGSFDLGLGGPVTPRPCLGGIGREFGDVKPDNGTGCAVNYSGALAGFRLRSQPKANDSNASPARQHFSKSPLSPIKLRGHPGSVDGTCI
jgi:hypothetical protein